MGVTFKLLKSIGTVGKTEKGEKKLQFVRWNDNEPCYDLRTWLSSNKASSGITLSKEDLLRIVELVKGDKIEEKPEAEEKPKTKKETSSTKSTKVEKPKTVNEPVKKATTKTNYTYEDCEIKLDDMFEKYNEIDSFVWLREELKKLAEKDNQFVQNIMRDSRTIDDMTLYARDKAYEKYGQGFMGGIADKDMLEYCIEYLNAEEKVVKPKTTTTKATTSKKTTSKTTSTKKTNKTNKTKVESTIDEELQFN